ncbi:glycosyltransferase family 10 domain-containing protein [Phycobacter azelaicus]|uniref:glycosyltransferase family 10 domain-containing protein n=1 Tax=Phycobacter azelaicus TaxID=2668075 RepID=UPI00186768BB|nr:glycosyltransferase family 10 [Phycobacter azelaicus]MBE1296623.1 hypothetical protein [Paracoccaceae bacterium]
MVAPIKAHVFTDTTGQPFLKQSPGCSPHVRNVTFTFGTAVPDDTDVLISFNRASHTIKTHVPKERTIFIAAEPDVIHPYSCRFLNQFGLVLTTTEKPLAAEKRHRAVCWYWWAGYDFSGNHAHRGYDWFKTLTPPEDKQDKIAIVTSNKVHTEYHRKRMRLVDTLIEQIPEHIEIYGRGFKPIGDKADALLPYKYNLAVENGEGPHVWTEKLTDPWLCWSFPFYAGCSNVGEYCPKDSFELINLDDPVAEASRMVQEIQNGRWEAAQSAIASARETVLEEENIMVLMANLAQEAAHRSTKPRSSHPHYIWSERSLWPEEGCRGSLPEWMLRNAILMFAPEAELKTRRLRDWYEVKKSERRARKLAKTERPQ